MTLRRSELEHFVRTIMSKRDQDHRVQLITEKYGTRFISMIKTLNINELTITSSLEIIAEEVLSNEWTLSHVLVLLVFCIELDEYCRSKQYIWYSQDNLIETIVNILWRVGFIVPSILDCFKICCIL